MPTVGQALQDQTPAQPGPRIRTVTAVASGTVDVGFGPIPNAITGATVAVGRRVVITWCEAVWVATSLLP